MLKKLTQKKLKPPQLKKAPVKKAPVKKAPVKKAPAKKAPVEESSCKESSLLLISRRKEKAPMSAKMKKHFHAVLIQWREHLKDEMKKTFDHLKNKGESYADPIDRASQEEEFALGD